MRWLATPFRPLAPLRWVGLRSPWAWRWLLLPLVTWTLVDTLLVRYRLDLARHKCRAHEAHPDNSTRIYIASLHWNNERILRDSWNQGVVDLATALGPSNVVVSVYESGSWDGSKAALTELGQALDAIGALRNITLDEVTHKDEMASPPSGSGNGWVETPRGRVELQRIPHLARLRNMSLQPLRDMAKNGTVFDYVLFLGYVVFTIADVLTLLDTNNRTMLRHVRWISAIHPGSMTHLP